MSATVAAALKKIAVYILTDKKALKVVCGIVLGIVIIIIMPIVAVLGIFNGSIEIDTDRLQQMVIDNLSAEEQAKLHFVETTMTDIETAMKEAGFTGRIKEAQVLYTLALSEKAHESDFVSKLVGCFVSDQTDEQLIDAVNSAFGTSLTAEDFTKVMNGIRGVYIDTSGYTDITAKNNFDLAKWAIEYCTNGIPDIGADTMYNTATEKGTIDTIPEIPGLAVWHKGYIGIYIGNGEVIHAANTNAGVIKTPIGTMNGGNA